PELIRSDDAYANLPDLRTTGGRCVRSLTFMRLADPAEVSYELFPCHTDAVILDDNPIRVRLDEDVYLTSISIVRVIDEFLQTRRWVAVEPRAQKVDDP